MHFAWRALAALHILTSLSRTTGLLVQQSIVQPSPRLPVECNKCKKLAEPWDLSCPSQKSVCECCRDIFQQRMKTLCKGFRKLDSAPDKDYCIDKVHMAMEHRDGACDTSYDYESPLRGITPLRYTDMCDGNTDTCGPSMCSDSGCNTQLEKVEGRYRVIAHYRKVYDTHPCEMAESRQWEKDKELRARKKAQQALRNGAAEEEKDDKQAAEKAATAAAAYAALKRAEAEKAAAEMKVNQKAAAEKEAAIKAASAQAALEYAKEERLLAETVLKQKAAAVEKAAQEHAAAQAALGTSPTSLAAHSTTG